MENISELWKKYNEYTLEISKALGTRTTNIVGEYAEYLINNHLKGRLLNASTPSADIKTSDNKFYQVKGRKVRGNIVTQLGIIRSWEFDYLAVVIFSQSGDVLKSIISPKETAEKHAVFNKHQHGWVITTSLDFLNDKNNQNITEIIKKYNGDSNGTEIEAQKRSTNHATPSTVHQSQKICNNHTKNVEYVFDPADEHAFKSQLLENRVAFIKIFYKDGRDEFKKWDANRFKESSNLRGNINSKTWFRNDYVQKHGVIKAMFSIKPFDQ